MDGGDVKCSIPFPFSCVIYEFNCVKNKKSRDV